MPKPGRQARLRLRPTRRPPSRSQRRRPRSQQRRCTPFIAAERPTPWPRHDEPTCLPQCCVRAQPPRDGTTRRAWAVCHPRRLPMSLLREASAWEMRRTGWRYASSTSRPEGRSAPSEDAGRPRLLLLAHRDGHETAQLWNISHVVAALYTRIERTAATTQPTSVRLSPSGMPPPMRPKPDATRTRALRPFALGESWQLAAVIGY